MSFQIPDLRSTNSRRLIACGRLTPSPTSLSKADFIAKTTKNNRVTYLRLMISEPRKKFQHFHLEVATPDFFPEGRTPKPNTESSQIEKIVHSVSGQDIHLYILGEFVLDVTELPELGGIRTLSKEIRSGGTSMRLTGGTLALEGSPISEVEWSMLDDSTVSISLELKQRSVVSESYLFDAHQLVSKLFSVFILENEAER